MKVLIQGGKQQRIWKVTGNIKQKCTEISIPCQAGEVGLIFGSKRSLGEGNGNPLQYSCLENPMDRGAWQATVHRVAKESDIETKL